MFFRRHLLVLITSLVLLIVALLALAYSTRSETNRILLLVPNDAIGRNLARRFREEFTLFEPLVRQHAVVIVQTADEVLSDSERRNALVQAFRQKPAVVIAMSHSIASAFLSEPPPSHLRAVIFATRGDPAELRRLAIENGHQATGIRSIGEYDDLDRARLVDEWLPGARHVGVLTDGGASSQRAVSAAQLHWKGKVRVFEYAARTAAEIHEQFALARRDGVSAMLIGDNNEAASNVASVAEAALKNRIPLVSDGVVLCDAAPAICFFSTTSSHYRRWLEATLQVISGMPANEIPVAGTDRGILICNVRAAHEIGSPIPDSLYLRAEYSYGRIVWDRVRAN